MSGEIVGSREYNREYRDNVFRLLFSEESKSKDLSRRGRWIRQWKIV